MASSTWWESSFSPAASRSAVRSATPPISRSGWRTVVSGGEAQPGDLGVVEADDAQVLGHPQAAGAGRLDDARRRSRRCRRRSRSAARGRSSSAAAAGRSRPRSGTRRVRTYPSGHAAPVGLHRGAVAVQPRLVAGRGRPGRRCRRCAGGPRDSRCWVAARPPAKLVEPTLVTRARGRLSGSMTTSGRRARASAARSAAVRSSDHGDHRLAAGRGEVAGPAAAVVGDRRLPVAAAHADRRRRRRPRSPASSDALDDLGGVRVELRRGSTSSIRWRPRPPRRVRPPRRRSRARWSRSCDARAGRRARRRCGR